MEADAVSKMLHILSVLKMMQGVQCNIYIVTHLLKKLHAFIEQCSQNLAIGKYP
jgi:TorA maturation chaperone TorD